MLCENCGNHLASVHIINTINGETEEKHLCSSCANQGQTHSAVGSITMQDILQGLMGVQRDKGNRCSHCGTSYQDFRKTGRLGCEQCYVELYSDLEPILIAMHGKTLRRARKLEGIEPLVKEENEIDQLQTQLNQAVEKEEYEKAAELRDKIKELQNIKGE